MENFGELSLKFWRICWQLQIFAVIIIGIGKNWWKKLVDCALFPMYDIIIIMCQGGTGYQVYIHLWFPLIWGVQLKVLSTKIKKY